MQPNLQIPADLGTFSEGIPNEKFHFCAVLREEKSKPSAAEKPEALMY